MKADPMSVEHKTVGELVAADYRKAEVFKRFGIDFCCGGGRTVEVACQKKGIPYSTLENEPGQRPPFGTVRNPITMMEVEHEHAGEILAEIRSLSHDFTPPEHACTTYRVAYFKLQEFEADLHKHIHLENNILFPSAIALEQQPSSPW